MDVMTAAARIELCDLIDDLQGELEHLADPAERRLSALLTRLRAIVEAPSRPAIPLQEPRPERQNPA